MRPLPPVLALALLALPCAAVQEPAGAPPSVMQTLRNARRTFSALDADADGLLDSEELRSGWIPSPDRTAFDHDGDGAFSGDEFLVYYARLLVSSGRGLGPELAREVTRIRRLRQEADASAGAAARVQAPRRSGGRTVAERLEQARRALETSVLARAEDAAGDGEASRERKRSVPEGASGLPIDAQLARAWRALDTAPRARRDGAAGFVPPPSGLAARDHVGERLERARKALGG